MPPQPCAGVSDSRAFRAASVAVARRKAVPSNLGRRCKLELGLCGNVRTSVEASPRWHEMRKSLDDLAASVPGRKPIHAQYLAKQLSERGAGDGIVGQRRRHTDTLGGDLPAHERPARAARLFRPWHDGECAVARDRTQIAYSGRQMVSMPADGGLAMLPGDQLSLRQNAPGINIVVFNNNALSFVEMKIKAGGYLETGTRLDDPDFVAVARSIDMLGVRCP